jgi:hypothetical protein
LSCPFPEARTEEHRVADQYLVNVNEVPEPFRTFWLTDLLIKVEVCQGQFDGFADFLLLHV